jgi:pimeloyl-ACP methyl ester carboxylesterase
MVIGMRFVRTPWGMALLILLLLVVLALGATAVRVYAKTHPGERPLIDIDFDSMEIPFESVEFDSPDGVILRGWLLRGLPEQPSVVLCHDQGEDRTSLVTTAVALRQSGFSVLMFDFRGHGESGGSSTTLGLLEKRDVLGAVEFLNRAGDVDTSRVGVYGVGMGAHAAVLASAELSEVRVLVLDSLYPDAAYPLVRDVYAEWGFAERNLSFVPRILFAAFHGTLIGRQRAADVIGRLQGRDLLLLAPAGDSALAQ